MARRAAGQGRPGTSVRTQHTAGQDRRCLPALLASRPKLRLQCRLPPQPCSALPSRLVQPPPPPPPHTHTHPLAAPPLHTHPPTTTTTITTAFGGSYQHLAKSTMSPPARSPLHHHSHTPTPHPHPIPGPTQRDEVVDGLWHHAAVQPQHDAASGLPAHAHVQVHLGCVCGARREWGPARKHTRVSGFWVQGIWGGVGRPRSRHVHPGGGGRGGRARGEAQAQAVGR